MENMELVYQKVILDYFNNHRFKKRNDSNSRFPPKTSLKAKAVTAVILDDTKQYQSLQYEFIHNDQMPIKANTAYRIFDKAINTNMIKEVVIRRMREATQYIDIYRNENKKALLLTSYFILKLKSIPFAIPLSRFAGIDPETNQPVFAIYPENAFNENMFITDFEDIQYIDVIVASSPRAFKKYLRAKNNADKNIDNLATETEFDESLV